MSILIQKRHPYTGNLNTEMSRDSKNTFLHGGGVLALCGGSGDWPGGFLAQAHAHAVAGCRVVSHDAEA